MNLVIASGKGGVGKSMLASTLAMLFAEEYKIVATDCDADTPNLAIWLGGVKKWDKTLPVITSARPKFDLDKCNGCGLCSKNCRFEAIKMNQDTPKLNPFLCEGCGACEVVCPQGAIKLEPIQNGEIKIKKDLGKFPLVSGQLFPGETGSGKIVDQIKAEAEKFNPEMMIIDSSPGTGCPVTAALRNADFTVLISEPTPSGFTDMKRILEIINHFKIPYGVVINKWDINIELSNKIEMWAGKKFLGKIAYDKKIFKAIGSLTPLLETNLEAKEEIKRIFKKLKVVLKKINK